MNKKIFITLFAFIGFMFFFNCSNVFASYDITVDGKTYSLPDLPEPIEGENSRYYLVYFDGEVRSGGKRYFRVMYSSTPITISYDKNYNINLRCSNDGSYYLCQLPNENKWTQYSLSTDNYGKYWYAGSFIPNDDGSLPWPFITSNHNITEYGSDKVVFQPAPQEEEPAPTPTSTLQVAPTLTSTDLSGILAQILAILPVVLMVLISLLALRKAIRLLLRILGQA